MNSGEGLRRIATVVRWIGIGVAVLCLALGLVLLFAFQNTEDRAFALLTSVIAAGLSYGAGRALGWIIEGFAS